MTLSCVALIAYVPTQRLDQTLKVGRWRRLDIDGFRRLGGAEPEARGMQRLSTEFSECLDERVVGCGRQSHAAPIDRVAN